MAVAVQLVGAAVLAGCGEEERPEARTDLERNRAALGDRLDRVGERTAREIAYGVRLVDAGERSDEVRAALIVDADLNENMAQAVVAGAPDVAATNLTREEAEDLVAKLRALGATVELIAPETPDADAGPAEAIRPESTAGGDDEGPGGP